MSKTKRGQEDVFARRTGRAAVEEVDEFADLESIDLGADDVPTETQGYSVEEDAAAEARIESELPISQERFISPEPERVCDECDKVFGMSQMVSVDGDWYCNEHAGPHVEMKNARDKARLMASQIKLTDEQAEALVLLSMQKLKPMLKTDTFTFQQIADMAEADDEAIMRGIACCIVHGTVHGLENSKYLLKPKTRKVETKRQTATPGQTSITKNGSVAITRRSKATHITSEDEEECTAEEATEAIDEAHKAGKKLMDKLLFLYSHKAWKALGLDSLEELLSKHFPTVNVARIYRALRANRVAGILNAATLSSTCSNRVAALLDPLSPEDIVNVYEKADEIAKAERDSKDPKAPYKLRDRHVVEAYDEIKPPTVSDSKQSKAGRASAASRLSSNPADARPDFGSTEEEAKGVLLNIKPIDLATVAVWVSNPAGTEKFWVRLPLELLPKTVDIPAEVSA